MTKLSRRDFLRMTALGLSGVALENFLVACSQQLTPEELAALSSPTAAAEATEAATATSEATELASTPTSEATAAPTATDMIPTRTLGKTGEQVTMYGLGGLFTTSRIEMQDQAVEIINRAIDLGVNYIDTSAMYGNGGSETNIGMVMRDRRDEVFLASKSHDYSYDGTMALFERSLQRLQTDHLDLYQHHYLSSEGQLAQLRGNNSARQAFEQLRDDGSIRYIGITSHSSRLLADALEEYPYDCALITLNAAQEVMDDPEDLDRFFRIAQENEVGVIAMKVVARGALVQRGLDVKQLLSYAWSYPISTAILGISEVAHLEENIRIAKEFEPMSAQEREQFRRIAMS